MACPTNRETILNGIKNRITELSQVERQGDVLIGTSEETREQINNLFEEEVIQEDGTLQISEELIDYYEQTLSAQEAGNINTPFLQEDRTDNLPVTPPEILSSIKGFLQRSNIDYQQVQKITVNGQELTANGIALPLQSLIMVTQGNEDITLAEEAFHIGVELISQKNKPLFQQMMDQITSYPIYKQVLAEYKESKFYQTETGRPDIQKIKKEAIGKLLVQTSIDQRAKSWWQKVLQWLKEFFTGYKTELNTFSEAVDVILTEDLGTVRDTLLKSEAYLMEQGFNEDQAQDVIDLAYSNITDDELRIAIANMVPQIIFEQVTPSTERQWKNLKELAVPSSTKSSTNENGKKNLNSSPEHQAVADRIDNKTKSDLYRDTQDILDRYIDDQGNLRDQPLPYTDSYSSKEEYDNLEINIAERLSNFPPGTKFLNGITLESKNKSATIDLIAITPDGKTNMILFQEVKVPEGGKLQGFEQKAYREIVDANLQILKELGYNRFGTTRAIPINTQDAVVIGTADSLQENTDYLLPIPSSQETTGIPGIDTLLKKLTGLANRLKDVPATYGTQFKKSQEIGAIFKSIRALHLQRDIKPLIRQANAVNKRLQELINRYNNDFKGKKINEDQKRAFSSEIIITRQVADTFSGIKSLLARTQQDDLKATKREIERLREASAEVAESQEQLDDILRDFTDEHIAQPLGIQNILAPEVVVKGLKRQFSQLSKGATKAVEALYKTIYPINKKVGMEQQAEIKKLLALKDKYTKWATDQGLTVKNLFSPITKYVDGRYQNQLIDHYNPQFYKDLRQAQEANDIGWLKNNIDTVAYDTWFQEDKTEVFEAIDLTTYSSDPEEDARIIEEEKQKYLDTFDISQNASIYNWKLKEFPLQKWESEEYKKIKGTPTLEFYNYITDKNNEAAELGVLEQWRSRTFLPSIRKDLTDKLVFGGSIRLGEGFLRSISADREDFEYGAVDPDTGQLKDKIPFYFLHDLSNRQTDKQGNEYRDYSMVSTDLFKVMEMYNRQILKYRYMSQVENEIKILSLVEANKDALATDSYGDQIIDGELITNVDNHKFLENYVKATVYGQKNVGAELDVKIGKVATGLAKKANKFLGRPVFSEDFTGNTIALSRVMDGATRLFSLKVLGLNLPVSISNFFGTSVTAAIQAGKDFSTQELAKMEFGVLTGQINDKKDTALVAALDYFLPLIEEETNIDKARQLHLSNINKFSFPELIMRVQTLSDRPIQWAIAGAMIQNTMVQDGKLVNIRRYLRSTPEYSNMYDLPEAERKQLRDTFEQKVKELQNTQSILQTGSFQDGVFTLPGIERNSPEVYEFIEKIQQTSRNASGMGNKEDLRQINLTLIGRSTMLFKGWLPRLVERRFGSLEKTPITGDYEWGRAKVMMNLLSKGIFKSAANLNNVLTLNDKGVDLMKDEYLIQQQKYEDRTGKEFEMTQTDFIEMYQRAIKNEMKELGVLFTLTAMIIAAGALAPPPEDDPQTKGYYKYASRLADKLQNELSFFYNPIEWAKMGQGGIFPALGIVTDIAKFTSHTGSQLWGWTTDNEEQMDKAKPTKYLMKNIPLARQLTPYMAIFMSEGLQKDFGTTPTSELQSH